LQNKARSEASPYYDLKQGFWQALCAIYPDLADLGFKPWRYPNNYVDLVEDPRIQLSV